MEEVFRYRDTFITCLAVFWLHARGQTSRTALFDKIGFRAQGPGGATHLAILPQGYAYESETSCPALDDDGACSLQYAGKPLQCRAVPLDPLVPDAEQAAVLSERMADAAFVGAACLRADDGGTPLMRGGSIAAAEAAGLQARRAQMEADRSLWGLSVFDMMRRELGAVPLFGYAALSVVPAVLEIARKTAGRSECVNFLEAQMALITRAADAARARRNPADRAMTRRLLAWHDTYRDALAALDAPPVRAAGFPRERARSIA